MFSIKVMYKNQEVGVVTANPANQNFYIFRYNDDFIKTGTELCPLLMPLEKKNYVFPNLSLNSFKGLPPLLADSLPDKYGSELLFAWQKMFNKTGLNPLEALSYIGKRGMGALEFVPSIDALIINEKEMLEIESLVGVANQLLNDRSSISYNLSNVKLTQLISVGSSIGGARAKAILAIDKNNNIKSGQISGLNGYEYCIVKFDGLGADISEDKNVTYYTRIEYAYYLMATSCGIKMMPSSLLKINNKFHFKTKRFDRTDEGEKIHMLSLAGMAGFDYMHPAENSYEEVALIMRKLSCDMDEVVQLYKRLVFNVICRNNDDHIKNISFLMDEKGKYHLSPAYDLSFSYNPRGDWTKHHQMKINGKVDEITLDDLLCVAEKMNITKSKATKLIDEVQTSAKNFKNFALEAELPGFVFEEIYDKFIFLK